MLRNYSQIVYVDENGDREYIICIEQLILTDFYYRFSFLTGLFSPISLGLVTKLDYLNRTYSKLITVYKL